MDKNNENENFEDCIEEKKEEKKEENQQLNNDKNKNDIKENENEEKAENKKEVSDEEKEENKTNNTNEEKQKEKETEDDNENKSKYIPYTIKKAQEKDDSDSPFPEKEKKDSDNEEGENEPKIELSEEQKKDIEEKIINERKNAGVLYKNKEYVQALNIYSLLLNDAKRADLKQQCCILNCNKGICFNKLYEFDKALDSFKEALKYNKDYSKALCNKMLLLHKKEEYLEAYEDFKRLKTLDYNLWENYRNMENELAYKAEIQKKKMTDEMLGKLKDVGNTILGKFGLSLNNFQMTPNGQGGYSIQYNNNK